MKDFFKEYWIICLFIAGGIGLVIIGFILPKYYNWEAAGVITSAAIAIVLGIVSYRNSKNLTELQKKQVDLYEKNRKYELEQFVNKHIVSIRSNCFNILVMHFPEPTDNRDIQAISTFIRIGQNNTDNVVFKLNECKDYFDNAKYEELKKIVISLTDFFRSININELDEDNFSTLKEIDEHINNYIKKYAASDLPYYRL